MLFQFGSKIYNTSEGNIMTSMSPFLSNPIDNTYIDEKLGLIHVIDKYLFTEQEFDDYIALLSGELRFVSDRLLDYMGHDNYLGCPSEIYCIKLHDDWVKKNIRKLDKYYDLEEIDIIQDRFKGVNDYLHKILDPKILRDGIVIIGQLPMYLAGEIDMYHSIDVYGINNKTLDALKRYFLIRENVSGIDSDEYNDVNYHTKDYISPSDVVHGLDIDCSGYVFELSTNKLFRTQRAKYSTLYAINYFNPSTIDPLYVSKLTEYKFLGFDIWLPYMNRVSFSEDAFLDLQRKYYRSLPNRDGSSIINAQPSVDTIDYLDKLGLDIDILESQIIKSQNKGQELGAYGIMAYFMFGKDNKIGEWPDDTSSTLLLSKFKNIYRARIPSYMYFIYDLSKNQADNKYYIKYESYVNLALSILPQPNKMSILKWYKESGLVDIK